MSNFYDAYKVDVAQDTYKTDPVLSSYISNSNKALSKIQTDFEQRNYINKCDIKDSVDFAVDYQIGNYYVTTGASDRIGYLPDVTTCIGRSFTFWKMDSGAGRIVITAVSSQLINGLATKTVDNRYDAYTVKSDGTQWLGYASGVSDPDLIALAALPGPGYVVKTSTDPTTPPTYANRTIIGTAHRVLVTNGNGVSGNTVLTTPQDIDIDSDVTFNTVTSNNITMNSGAALLSSCILLYKMNDNAPLTVVTDDSGKSNNGVSSPHATNYMHRITPYAMIDGAFYFDGSDDYIDAGSDVNSDMYGRSITIAVWVAIDGPQTRTLLQNYNISNGIDLSIVQNGINEDITFTVAGAGAITTVTPITTATWHLIVCSYDKITGAAYIKVDNVLNSTAVLAAGGCGPGEHNLTIGRDATWPYNYYHGYMDILGLYTKVLSTSECTALWNNGLGTENIADWGLRTNFKQYSIPFTDANGYLVEDNDNFRYDYDNDLFYVGSGSSGSNLATSLILEYKCNDNTASTVAVNTALGAIDGTTNRNTNLMHTTGLINGAFQFSGTPDLIYSFYPALNLVGESITLECWVNFAPFAGNLYLFCKSESDPQYGGSTSGYSLFINNLFGTYLVWFVIGGRGEHRCSIGINPNIWNHIICTYNKTTGAFVIYTNGLVNDFGTFSTGGVITNVNALFNAYNPFDTDYSTLKMDIIRIYDTDLTATEVNYLYNAGIGMEYVGSVYKDIAYFDGNIEVSGDLKGNLNWSYLNNVPTIFTNSPLTGGGQLLTNLTLDINSATTSIEGVVQLSNSYIGTSQVLATTEKALTDGLATKLGSESDTLSSVTGRGATTSTLSSFYNGLELGKNETTPTPNIAGTLKLWSAGDNGFYNTITSGINASASLNYVLPLTAPSSNALLNSDASGNWSWLVNNLDNIPNGSTSKLGQDCSSEGSPTFKIATLSDLILGSVPFAGTGGLLSQDNSNFFWDNVNKKLGIGTASPGEILTACTTANRSSLLFSSGVSPRTSHTILYSGFDAQNSTTVEVASDTYGSFLISANQPNAAYAYLGGLSWVNRYGRVEGTDELRVAYIAGKTDLSTNSCLLSFLLASSGVLSEKMLLNSSGNLQINGKLSVGTSALPGTTLEVKNTTSSFTADFLGSGQSSIVRNQAPTAVNQVAYALYDYDDPNNKWVSIGLERTTAPILGGTRNDLLIRQGTSGRDIRFGTNIGGTIATRAMLVSAGYFGVNVTPTSHIHTGGSFAAAVTPKSANFTADVNGYHYLVTTGNSADVTATLPAAVGCAGRIYQFTKVDSGTKNIIIDGNLSETINGALTKTSVTQYDSITIQSDGSNWLITAMPFNAWV